MALEIKSMYTILKDLINWTTARTDKITDFNVGSGIRTMYEAFSVQLEEFYFRMKQNTLYAIATSIYTSFDFERKVAGNATGYVTVSFTRALPTALTFPKGTVFCTSDTYGYIYFETIEEHTAKAGLTSTAIKVQCKEAGVIGNVPSGAISLIVPTNSLIRNIYNEEAFTDGRDAETATEHKKRFQQYINTLSRATSRAILYGTLQVEGVTGAWVDDNYIGYVKVYAHNSDGELPNELQSAILKHLIEYRAAGIEVEVLPIVKVIIDQSINVMIGDEYDTDNYAGLIDATVTKYLNEYSVGTNYHVADVIHFIKSSYEDAVINVSMPGAKDIELYKNQVIRPGGITVTCTNQKDWRYN